MSVLCRRWLGRALRRPVAHLHPLPRSSRGADTRARYDFGSRGPIESDELIRSAGYKYGSGYTRKWKRRFESSSALAFLEESFELNVKSLRHLRNTFVNEMRRGLKNVGSTIKMIPSYVALRAV